MIGSILQVRSKVFLQMHLIGPHHYFQYQQRTLQPEPLIQVPLANYAYDPSPQSTFPTPWPFPSIKASSLSSFVTHPCLWVKIA